MMMFYTYFQLLFDKMTLAQIYNQIIMLTRGQAKVPLNVMLLLSLLAVLCSLAATIVTVVKKYVGFGVYSNPITCTSSSSYLTQKYNHNNYIIAINIAEGLAVLIGTALLILVAVLRVKLSKGADEPEQIFQAWTDRIHRAFFLLPSISIVVLVVPTAFFSSFVIEVGKSCSSSVLTEWIIIGALVGLALILYLVSAIVAFKIRTKFDPPEEDIELPEEKQQNKQKSSAKNELEKGDDQNINHQQLGRSKINNLQEKADDTTNRQFLPQGITQPPLKQITRSGLRQPLITVHEPRFPAESKSQNSFVTQSELQRSEKRKLQALRRQRLEQEKRIQQLKRKAIDDRDKKEQKSNGNQTIINIHLDGTRGGSITQKQADEDPQPERNRRKNKNYEALRSPIYEQLSEDSEYHYQRNHKQPKDDRRFYSKKQYEAKEANPYAQRYERQIAGQSLQRSPSQQVNMLLPKPAKKLSLGHLTSVQITPTISPKPISALMPGAKYEESEVQKILDKDRYEESFYKNLMQESAGRETGLQQPKPSKKAKKPKQNNLEAYIEALNLSMNVNRPDYENNYFSNGSEVSYNSVLSNRVGAMPTERDYHSRRQQKIHPAGRDNNLLTVTQKIQQKYKRN